MRITPRRGETLALLLSLMAAAPGGAVSLGERDAIESASTPGGRDAIESASTPGGIVGPRAASPPTAPATGADDRPGGPGDDDRRLTAVIGDGAGSPEVMLDLGPGAGNAVTVGIQRLTLTAETPERIEVVLRLDLENLMAGPTAAAIPAAPAPLARAAWGLGFLALAGGLVTVGVSYGWLRRRDERLAAIDGYPEEEFAD